MQVKTEDIFDDMISYY